MKHVFYRADNARGTLVLLHGTGGDEESLISIARTLSSDMNYLGIRGKVDENGSNRFFKRLAEGVFDMEDLKYRTDELAVFLRGAADMYGFSTHDLYLVGYSNGANMAANLLLREPRLMAGAILFHAMVPSREETGRTLQGKSVFLSAGINDPLVPVAEAKELQQMLTDRLATVTIHWEQQGHAISSTEIEAARKWLAQ